MTATDELRKMLDERGVEHFDSYDYTEWDAGGIHYLASNHLRLRGRMVLRRTCTPEQAIEATLGLGTCRNIHESPKDGAFWPSPHFKCSVCGETHVSIDYVYFCPNCGRRVVAGDA